LEKETYGDTLENLKKTETEAKDAPVAEKPAPETAPEKRAVTRYPELPPQDDGFRYMDTPTKVRRRGAPVAAPAPDPLTEFMDWEVSDDNDDAFLTKHSRKRTRIESENSLAFTDSPPPSPKRPTHAAPLSRKLLDAFTTPPRQIASTPHTPPDTRHKSPGDKLNPITYSLLQQLSPHQKDMGVGLWESVRGHMLRCSRVAEGAVKGREDARHEILLARGKVEELERRVRILEAEREVDRAVIGALKRNVDILTGKSKRDD
jgi:hypothetical protein